MKKSKNKSKDFPNSYPPIVIAFFLSFALILASSLGGCGRNPLSQDVPYTYWDDPTPDTTRHENSSLKDEENSRYSFNFKLQGTTQNSSQTVPQPAPKTTKAANTFTTPALHPKDQLIVSFSIDPLGSIEGDFNPFHFQCVKINVQLSNGSSIPLFISTEASPSVGACDGATQNPTAVFHFPRVQNKGLLKTKDAVTVTVSAEAYDNCFPASLNSGCTLIPLHSSHQIRGILTLEMISDSSDASTSSNLD